jgi:hypothetical protein
MESYQEKEEGNSAKKRLLMSVKSTDLQHQASRQVGWLMHYFTSTVEAKGHLSEEMTEKLALLTKRIDLLGFQ